ncbi:hypothetical protein KP509_25G012100 [Ceratopteris richardii]|uniref:Telomeric single stranded DNA binding POT1/Cdc13 domain-containing protein n=1 Tax=Ceratopteris richardii TaxID=49495 RepID=A0A8T2RQ20_CERRI|nr:hypothetical protein KP509_25G012100 [Ceratopteris richardii]
MAMPEQYKYERLLDAALCVGQRVNFYGAVSEYEEPKRTRGSDLICTMTVSDMSLSCPGLRVLVFSSTIESLPQVKSVGDIIRFHRVTDYSLPSANYHQMKMIPFNINVHNGVAQAVAKIKHGASFLLFDGKQGVGHTPYQASSQHHTMQDGDCRIIDLLRSWIITQPLSSGSTDYLVPISGIKEGNYFDLCCKIMAVDHQEFNHVIILYVWDGTDVEPSLVEMTCTVQAREGQNFDSVADLRPEGMPPLSREVIATFPPFGTVLPVVPDLPIENLPLKLPTSSTWIKFRNLNCRIQNGIYVAVFLHESKISILSATSELVTECERRYQGRLLDNSGGFLPQWIPTPLHSLTDYEHIPFSTLRQILSYSQVTYKFRCLVRVVSIVPPVIEDFCVQKRSSTRASEYIYRLRLTLEDPTSRIHAYLCDEDAEYFFNGHPATDLHDATVIKSALQRKINELLGVEEHNLYGSAKSDKRCNPPWIKCCLKSYYLQKEDPWSSRCFKVFGTILA